MSDCGCPNRALTMRVRPRRPNVTLERGGVDSAAGLARPEWNLRLGGRYHTVRSTELDCPDDRRVHPIRDVVGRRERHFAEPCLVQPLFVFRERERPGDAV